MISYFDRLSPLSLHFKQKRLLNMTPQEIVCLVRAQGALSYHVLILDNFRPAREAAKHLDKTKKYQ